MTWKLCAIGTADKKWVPDEEEKKEEEAPRNSGAWGLAEKAEWDSRDGGGKRHSGAWSLAEKAEDSRDGGGGGGGKRRRGGGGGWPSSRPTPPAADKAMRSIQGMMLNCRGSLACWFCDVLHIPYALGTMS